ncbi:MAG: thymidine phosphorylase family protein [Hyphomonadaceae bacterium]|nr:thymidine phosphorylase family protein [Hyphomonadaceae bacterium]
MSKRAGKPSADRPTALRVKALPVDTLRENVVMLARDCRALRPERLKGSRKVEVRGAGRSIVASILIVDDPALVSATDVGITRPALERLCLADGDDVVIAPAVSPESLDSVRAKIRGETLSEEAIFAIVRDLAAHRYSDMEIAAFLIASASFMIAEEVLALTRAMADVGTRLDWKRDLIVDKHCIGGIPGNRTTMIVAPIVAAHGLTMPKTSSRAITSPAGTADTMEVFARVDLGVDEMHAAVEKCGACIIWGGHVNLSPADDVLISVERPLSIDTPEQMVASILSKKLAAGSTHLLVDMPVGPTAKIRSGVYAQRVRKLFEFVGARLGIAVEVMVTDGGAPIGRGVGPVLEARDVRAVLDRSADAPMDLREKSLDLAGRLLEYDPAMRGGQGRARARDLLDSGAAARAMDAIIEAQGPPPRTARLGPLTHEVVAPHGGVVASMDCFRIARLARLAGAPTDPGAGLDLLKCTGETVRAGEPLMRIHGEEPSDFEAAVEAATRTCGIDVSAP